MNRRRLLIQVFLGAFAAPSARAGAYEDFFRAIEVDNDTGLVDLLVRGMDPNTLDPRGQHGLYVALRVGSMRAFGALMRQPAIDVDRPNGVGETPLMMAALRANLDAMRALIARGAQVRRNGWTPLHYAASSPQPEPVQLLLDSGSSVDPRAPNGNTPLMLAARYGSQASVEMLLARGADRRLRNERGLAAADQARLEGRESLARQLEASP